MKFILNRRWRFLWPISDPKAFSRNRCGRAYFVPACIVAPGSHWNLSRNQLMNAKVRSRRIAARNAMRNSILPHTTRLTPSDESLVCNIIMWVGQGERNQFALPIQTLQREGDSLPSSACLIHLVDPQVEETTAVPRISRVATHLAGTPPKLMMSYFSARAFITSSLAKSASEHRPSSARYWSKPDG